MTEARGWSVWQWLTGKRKVRAAGEAANAALDKAEKRAKAEWPDHLKKLYRQMEARVPVDEADPLHHAVAEVKKADDEAYAARIESAAAFDEAERRKSSSLAREGAQRALDAYGFHERAIAKAEAVARHKVSL